MRQGCYIQEILRHEDFFQGKTLKYVILVIKDGF